MKEETYGFLSIPSEPDGREMPPTELSLHNVAPILEGISDPNRMVPSSPVILGAFVFRRVISAVAPITVTILRH